MSNRNNRDRETQPSPDTFLPTRSTLIDKLRKWDDRTSWDRFYDTYHNLIFHTALRAGLSEQEAQDVVQETMLSVSKQIKNFTFDRKAGHFKGWLLKNTRWRIIDQLRKRDNALMLSDTAEKDVGDLPEGVESDLERMWNEEWVTTLRDAAIQQIRNDVKPLQLQAWMLLESGNTPEEVATELGVRKHFVYLAKHRVDRRVHQAFRKISRQPGYS